MKNTINIFFLFVIILVPNSFISAQVENGYKGILPIKSNCQDVERILNIMACGKYEVSIKSESETVTIFFTTEVCQEIPFNRKLDYPFGTVSRISTDFNGPTTLKSLNINVDSFKQSYSDIQTFFVSKEKGIEIVVDNFFKVGSENLVIRIIYYPPQNGIKLCPPDKTPSKPLKIQDIEGPIFEVERYWNLSLKQEKLRIEKLIPKINQLLEANKINQIFVFYYYKSEKDIKLAQKQAAQTKKILEINGINPDIINVINGRKQNKSEIVIYYEF